MNSVYETIDGSNSSFGIVEAERKVIVFGLRGCPRFVFLFVAKYIAARLRGPRSDALGVFRILTTKSLEKAFVKNYVPRC